MPTETVTAEVREVERVRRPECWAAVRTWVDAADGDVLVVIHPHETEAAAERDAERMRSQGLPGVAVVRIPGEIT